MRLDLIVQNGTLAGRRISLDEGSLSLGRSPDCEVQFDSEKDRTVSHHHAVVQKSNEDFYVSDQNSTNGTLVNGKRTKQARLFSGDIVQLGRQGPKILISIASDTIPPHRPEAFENITNRALFNPDKDKQTNYARAILAIGITGIFILIVLGLLLATVGLEGLLVGGIMAFLPAPLYLFIYLWMDRYDPEPPWALASAFAWGALFSIFVSFIINTIFGSVVETIAGKPAGMTLAAVLSAPFIEELTKGTGVFLISLFLRSEFDGVLDGIVYAGVIGLGFATVENVLYYGGTFREAGIGALLVTGFLRGVLSPFIHSFFTSMTGIGCGLARESHSRFIQISMPLVGLCAAMFLHSIWNLSASLMGGLFFVAYFIIWVPLFSIFVFSIVMIAKREKNIIRRSLAFEVGSLLSPEELDLVSSLSRRIQWLLSVKSWNKLGARRRYLRALTKLAFCYWHVGRAASANSHTISTQQIPHFRSEVVALRNQI